MFGKKGYEKKVRLLSLVGSLRFNGGGRVVRWCWANFQYRGVLLIWIRLGQGPSVLAVGAGGGCLDIFFSRQSFLILSPIRPDID